MPPFKFNGNHATIGRIQLAVAAILIALTTQGCGGSPTSIATEKPGSENAIGSGDLASSESTDNSSLSIDTGSQDTLTVSEGATDATDSGSDQGDVTEPTAGAANVADAEMDLEAEELPSAEEQLVPIEQEELIPEFNAIPDTDFDGILDTVETQADRDLDSIPNYMDTDSDGDGIPDEIEGSGDADADTIPNFLDLDSDDDSGSDQLEGLLDTDQDGLPNYLDPDSDNDGLRDLLERWGDSDSDGIVDAEDTDSDNDGISDLLEGLEDLDMDGRFNYLDDDSDGDGLSDLLESDDDFDADGVINAFDLDSDNDGMSDADEGALDSDSDGQPNFLDVPLVPEFPAELLIGFDANQLIFEWTDLSDADEYQIFANLDGGSGFVPISDPVPAGVNLLKLDIDVHLSVETSFMLQSCAQNGCVDSEEQFVSAGLVNAIGYLKASHSQDSALNYGAAVAISGDAQTMAVSAPGDTNNSHGVDGAQDAQDPAHANSGAVFVYAKATNGWVEQAFLKASNSRAHDVFGHAISLSSDGQTLAIGAPKEDSNSTGVNGYQLSYSAIDSGAVYVFTRSGQSWTQSAYLKSANSEANDHFGESLELSSTGLVLAVGAPAESSGSVGVDSDASDNSRSEAGAAYVFTNANGAWSQQAYVKPMVIDAEDLFGSSVSLNESGTRLLVGAPGEDAGGQSGVHDPMDNSVSNSGAVYVFEQSSGDWTQSSYIKPAITGQDDAFGNAISLSDSGDTLAISASKEDSNSIGIDGDDLNDYTTNAGAVYVFTHGGASWEQEAYLKPPATKAQAYFGSSIALTSDGDWLAVGSYGDASPSTGLDGDRNGNTASFSGAVHLFHRELGLWSYARFIKASNTDSGDTFGTSVSISDDGKKLLVGAHQEQSSSLGFQGPADNNDVPGAGAAYLY